jgi:hypothetical protein
VPGSLLVVISGELGSGKSTLARALAPRRGATVLSKDLLKEAMYDPLQLTSNQTSKAGSVAAIRIIYAIAAASSSPLVLEANWKPLDVPQLVALDRPTVQVCCTAPPEVLVERVRTRERHPVHRDRAVPEVFAHVIDAIERRTFRPLGLPCPRIDVRTDEPIDLDALVAEIRSCGRPPREPG